MKRKFLALAFGLVFMEAFSAPALAETNFCPVGYKQVLIAIVIEPDGEPVPIFQCQPDGKQKSSASFG